MATFVFGAVGTLIGGPISGAIGSLIGNQIDHAIIGNSNRDGPRLKELAVSTSSYGQPIARLFGATRAGGTIIWSTDMKETSETVSGGKGKPGTTQYSYSISLAVALSSRPIERVGRIWADGNLLRGEAGDMKTGGTLRVHLGHGDQEADPLLAAALGAECPAHRGLAYAVLEDLQLGEFGNRIPALSFEVFANGGGAQLVEALLEPVEAAGQVIAAASELTGFAHDGGSLASILDAMNALVPLTVDSSEAGPSVRGENSPDAVPILPASVAWPDGEFGTRTGQRRSRAGTPGPTALRYYDSGRDYQPGLQRASGPASLAGERTLELPATMSASGASALIDAAALRGRSKGERAQVRIASLDPALTVGKVVRLSGAGQWRIAGWEWRSGGVELDLARTEPTGFTPAAADAGNPWRPSDRLPAKSVLHAFELPWDGAGAADAVRLHIAVGASQGRWAGAALYAERAGVLVPVGSASPPRAITATLTAPLGSSPALMFEPAAAIELHCDDSAAQFASVDGAALASGANRLLVGDEIVQFRAAEPLGDGHWRLSGLLRGRGATEAEAVDGHGLGTRAVLLDERLLLFDATILDSGTERLAAIGAGDDAPVFAHVAAAGRSRRPLPPVHPVARMQADGSLQLRWTRRARGAWIWTDGVDAPLVEEVEAYEVGAGLIGAPIAQWTTSTPALAIDGADLAALPSGTALWVRQIGTHARSAALLLHTIT